MAEINWSELWDDSGEDDEDYDPAKDPLLQNQSEDDGDSDLEDFQRLLSPGGRQSHALQPSSVHSQLCRRMV